MVDASDQYPNRGMSDDKQTADASGDMLKNLTGRQLKFDYFSADILKQLLKERVTIRDKNRGLILSRLSDLSGDINGVYILTTPDGDKRRQGLERTRMDLEKQLRDEDATLWKDSIELRRELILAEKKYAGSQFRQGLMSSMPSLDDSKGQTNAGFSG